MEKVYFYCYGCFVGEHTSCSRSSSCSCFLVNGCGVESPIDVESSMNIEDCLLYTE